MARLRLVSLGLGAALACSLTAAAAQTGIDTPDDVGATPLMYAAAFGTLDEMRALIDRGAAVNATARDGATPLMWAAADTAKVRLLLERGAVVNARAADGTTPLVAAVHRGNAAAMRLLIQHGADMKAPADDLLVAAYGAASPEGRQVLREAGLTASSIKQVFTALGRIDKLDAPLAIDLTGLGLPPDAKMPFVTVQFPLHAYAAFTGDVELMRALLERGANPNVASNRGTTPLMMAAASNRPSLAIVALLIEKGATLDARDDQGRTALDWARLQGRHTSMVAALRAAGVPEGAPLPPAPAPATRARPLPDAMRAALARMDAIGPAFYGRTKCVSCHNQSLPAMARVMAAARGVPVEPAVASHATQATLDVWKPQRSGFMVGRCGGGGFVQITTYGLNAMAAEGMPRTTLTDAVVTCLATRQDADGSWPAMDVRPPLGGIAHLFTALAIRALDAYTPPGLRADTDARIARAREFLRASRPDDTQEAAMKLLGLVWSKASPAEVDAHVQTLVALQQPDGGWAQVASMRSDAYATGQALYALAASGMPASAKHYRKGVSFLLDTQLEDGSWFVRARGFAFQPYLDYGFPHGTDQFISAAATSWAVMALAQ